MYLRTLCRALPLFLFFMAASLPAFALNLGGQSAGFSVILPKDWKLLEKEQHDEIAKVLVAPYDPDGSANLASSVQAAIYMGSEPADFRQITVVPIPYGNLPGTPEDAKKLAALDKKTLALQKEEVEKGVANGGLTVLRSGTLSDGYWILGSVNNTILQEVQMRYTKKGALMILLFAGGTDKKAENAVKELGKKVVVSPANRIAKKK